MEMETNENEISLELSYLKNLLQRREVGELLFLKKHPVMQVSSTLGFESIVQLM